VLLLLEKKQETSDSETWQKMKRKKKDWDRNDACMNRHLKRQLGHATPLIFLLCFECEGGLPEAPKGNRSEAQ